MVAKVCKILEMEQEQEVDKQLEYLVLASDGLWDVVKNEIVTADEPKKNDIDGFFESIRKLLTTIWNGLADFFTGKTCRHKCSGFFDFRCHIQYICVSWILLFGLLLAIFPTVIVLLWLFHQKGLFDCLYCWDGESQEIETPKKHGKGISQSRTHYHHDEDYEMDHKGRTHPPRLHHKRRSSTPSHHYALHRHNPTGLVLSGHHHRKNESHTHGHRHKNKHGKSYSQGYKPCRDGTISRETMRNHEERQGGRKHSKQEHQIKDDMYGFQ